MTWYNKQLKIAAPKDKIRKFNVTDPVLQVFIQQYEKLVDWNSVKDQDDIQDYIYDVLIPPVISQIERDSENNVYIKDYDLDREVEILMNDPTFPMHPQYQQAMQAMQYYRMYPEQSKEQALSIVNNEKEQIFDKWWNYLTEVNQEYSENPAWLYMVMNSLVKSSPETSQTMPMTLNAQALAEIWYGLHENPSPLNFAKTYQSVSARIDAENAEFIATDASGESGWISIPGEKKDPANFEENVDKLIRFSHGNNWCTASGGASGFLKQGNFWLYLENGRAVVAVRTFDNNGQEVVAEIQAPGNEPPLAHAQQIKQFIDSKPDLVWDKAIHYQRIMDNLQQEPQNQIDPTQEVETEEEDWTQLQEEWDSFDQTDDLDEKRAFSKNWYKLGQAEGMDVRGNPPSSYYDIGHVGWNFGDDEGKIQKAETIWIIDEDWQFDEVSTGIAEAQEKGIKDPLSSIRHGLIWPHMAGTDFDAQEVKEAYVARGRYEKNNRGEYVSVLFPYKIQLLSMNNPRKYEYLKKRVDKMLERKYPNATIKWY